MDLINCYKTPTNTWIIEKSNSCYGSKIVLSIDGREESVPSGQNLETAEEPKSIIKIDWKTVVVDYRNADGAVLSPAEWTNQIHALKLKEKCIDDEYIWDSLEDEFAYRKFLQEWTPTYAQEKVETPYQIVYKKLPVSKYTFIVPLYQFGKEGISNPHCYYLPPVMEMITAAAQKYGFERVEDRTFGGENTAGKKWSMGTTGFRFIKINGTYRCNDGDEKRVQARTDTYGNCVALYAEHCKLFDNMFAQQARIIEKQPLEESERKTLLENLKKVRSYLKDVEPKSKSYSDFNIARNQLDAVIESL